MSNNADPHFAGDEVERIVSKKAGCKYVAVLSAGTTALHMVVKLVGVKSGDKQSRWALPSRIAGWGAFGNYHSTPLVTTSLKQRFRLFNTLQR